jgi:hypothetical protein
MATSKNNNRRITSLQSLNIYVIRNLLLGVLGAQYLICSRPDWYSVPGTTDF